MSADFEMRCMIAVRLDRGESSALQGDGSASRTTSRRLLLNVFEGERKAAMHGAYSVVTWPRALLLHSKISTRFGPLWQSICLTKRMLILQYLPRLEHRYTSNSVVASHDGNYTLW